MLQFVTKDFMFLCNGACIVSCFCVVIVQHFLFPVNQLMCFVCSLYLFISCGLTYLKTSLTFFPFVGAFQHINQRLSSRIFSELGSLLPIEAPGMSFSCRHKELLTQLVSFTLFSITQLFQTTCCPLYCIYLCSNYSL